MKIALIPRIALSAVFVAALVSAAGGAVYYFFNLSFLPIIAVALISFFVSLTILPRLFAKNEVTMLAETARGEPYLVVLPLVYVLAGVSLILLYRAGTTDAINSPWLKVTVLFWVAFVLMCAASATILIRAKNHLINFLAALPVIAVALSVAALVYKIGYGFDPFIHRSAEQFILDHGSILPKTPYYAGLYALVVVVAAISRIPLRTVDIWILPALASLGIISTLIFSGVKTGKNTGLLLIATLAILPFSFFINTTPFGLACLYVLMASIFALSQSDYKTIRLVIWIFAVAALITHPIAGVPAIILATLFSFKNKIARIAVMIFGAIGVPVLFLIQGTKLIFNPGNILSLPLPFELPLNRFHPLGDLVYATGAIGAALIVIFFLVAFVKKQPAAKIGGLAALAAIFGAAITATTIDFSYLPVEEQAGYPARLLVIALLILVPVAASAFSDFLKKILVRPLYAAVAVSFLVFLISGNAYLSYPRSDAYILGKGWSVSAADLNAVTAIAKNAGSEPYIVLASEPVSAAALDKFGFFKYFKTSGGDLFAYPIPLGGDLYKFYLKMIYDFTSAATMHEAMALAGVKRGYFVMNPYWTGFARISAAALESADAEIPSGGNDTVFVYTTK
jgi:hypothetical protein